ncbi:MAG: alpha/beta fold hydrolase [Acidimicrobiales bacterium]
MPRTPADDTHPVLPGCAPWSSPAGGPNGALVLHGFTGSPVSMRPLAEALAGVGFAVEMPRLPGHGTAPEDLAETGWDDWLAEAERALSALQARTPDGRVVVVGLSMGGALTLAVAEAHAELAGIVLINTPTSAPAELAAGIEGMIAGGVDVIDSVGGDIADPEADEASYDKTPLRPLLTMLQAGEGVRARLSDITQPTLIVTSRQDHVVTPTDSDVIAEHVSGPVERIWLDKSFHVATLDYDKAEVEQRAVEFAQRVTG